MALIVFESIYDPKAKEFELGSVTELNYIEKVLINQTLWRKRSNGHDHKRQALKQRTWEEVTTDTFTCETCGGVHLHARAVMLSHRCSS